ncbi:HAD family phosphatase [candidate division KSB1 bacterium]|nr:HAD family phosphatase [candidate division KSB1 bacterium]
MVKAILFDYDGVLVNSMPFHVKAWQSVFTDFEITIKPEEVLLREGARPIELAREIFADRSVEISELELKEFIDKKQKIYRKITEAKIENGTESFLKSLKQRGNLIGLVTGTVRLNVEHSHSPEFIELFDTITTADDIKNGKPNPECYLNAARELAISPELCLAVENAPLGIQAAKNAGMQVAALMTTLDKESLPDADFYANDLVEFETIFENISTNNHKLN